MPYMLIKSLIKCVLPLSVFVTGLALADTFKLTSSDISPGKFMGKAQEYQGFGCNGGNLSPQLSWAGAPQGTAAYAVLAFDPDASTSGGWWHWQVLNIPKDVTGLAAGAGDPAKHAMPAGSTSIDNDFGSAGFGGACPPKGSGVHRYQFTVYALPKKLELPKDANGTAIGAMVRSKALASSTIEALYKRD